MNSETPTPVRVVKRAVVIEGSYCSGGYRRRVIGYSVAVILSDGSEKTCTHAHKSNDTARKCAQTIVNQINRSLP